MSESHKIFLDQWLSLADWYLELLLLQYDRQLHQLCID